MEILWDCPAEVCTRDVEEQTSRTLAYTTIATVLNNLVKKALGERVHAGRTWAFRPLRSRGGLLATNDPVGRDERDSTPWRCPRTFSPGRPVGSAGRHAPQRSSPSWNVPR